MASIYDLKHKSEGEGNRRFIVIHKKNDSSLTRLVCEASAYPIPSSEIVTKILQQSEKINNNPEVVQKKKGRPAGSTNKTSYERVERELRTRKK